MRAATASFAIGTLISILVMPYASAVAQVESAKTQQAASQEKRVCKDVVRPGSRVANRVCGTPAEVQAYLRQDFYAKASDPLLQAPSGGQASCWTRPKDGAWEPCPKGQPVEPTPAAH